MKSTPDDASNLLGQELSEAVLLFHQTVAQKVGLSATEWKCLDILRRSGPVPARTLSDETGLTTGAITGIIDRLEKNGYVKRERNKLDRRSIIIQPLYRQDLIDKVVPIFNSLGEAMVVLSNQFSNDELKAIRKFMEGSILILKEQRKKLTVP